MSIVYAAYMTPDQDCGPTQTEKARPFLDALMAQRAARAEADRRAFFESDDEVPDLDMWPDCPICEIGNMDYDENWYCTDCGVSWDRNGENGTRDE